MLLILPIGTGFFTELRDFLISAAEEPLLGGPKFR